MRFAGETDGEATVRQRRELGPGQQRGRQNRPTTRRKRFHQRRLLPRDRRERTDAFQVNRGDGGDDGDIRSDDRGADAEFTWHAHAGFDDRKAMPVGAQPQEHQRYAQKVVQVGLGDEGGRTQQSAQQILGRGLADAPRDADDRPGETLPPSRGDALQTRLRIGDHQLRERIRHRMRHHGAGRPLGARVAQEIMAIAARRPQGHERIAGPQGARVRPEAGDGGHRRGRPGPLGPRGEIRRRKGSGHAAGPLRSSNNSRTT